jgi:hypothetical protein
MAMTMIPSFSCLPWPEKIVLEAFDAGPLRVPKQIAAVLGMSLDDVQLTFGDALESLEWPPPKFSEDTIFKVAERLGISCYQFSPFLARREVTDSHARSLVFASWDGILYVYRDVANFARLRSIFKPIDAKLVKSTRHPPQRIEEFNWFPDARIEHIPSGT